MSVSSSEALVAVPVSFVSSFVSSFETSFELSVDACSEVDSLTASEEDPVPELTSDVSEEAEFVASGISKTDSFKDSRLYDSSRCLSYSSI